MIKPPLHSAGSPRHPLLSAALLCLTLVTAHTRAEQTLITERAVRAHMDFLAGDALHGRGSGSRDEWIAATYLASQMRAYGLEPLGDDGGFVQTIDISRTQVVGLPQLQAGSQRFLQGAQMLVLDLNSPHVNASLQKYHPGAAVRAGAALLMPVGAEPANVSGLDAAAIILWRESPASRRQWDSLQSRRLTVGRTRLTALPPNVAPVPGAGAQILLNTAAYEAIATLPEASVVSFSAETQEVASRTWNAVGRIGGSDKSLRDEIILLTAHLDHLGEQGDGPDRIYNGADDDASGTIAVLTLAEAISKGARPKRSVVFALFGSEEVGSFGARYFLQKSTVPVDRIIANLEFEMIGRSDKAVADHTLWLTGWERTNLGPALAVHGARIVADPHPRENFFMRSDNITLARRGVVAQTVSSYGLHEQYHQPTDDIAHIDFQHMTESIQSMLGPIRWLAGSTFKPEWLPGGRP
jgi:hypothetical protein